MRDASNTSVTRDIYLHWPVARERCCHISQFNTVQPFKHSFQLGELQENQKQERRYESRLRSRL